MGSLRPKNEIFVVTFEKCLGSAKFHTMGAELGLPCSGDFKDQFLIVYQAMEVGKQFASSEWSTRLGG
jgi:hypothetical protein